jgi:hypothetical protein
MSSRTSNLSIIAASVALLCSSCGKNDTTSAPPPLSQDQIPSAISQAFVNSDKETQDQANIYVNDEKNHNFAAAFEEIQHLTHRPGLTPDQRAVLAGAFRTTSQEVQEAAAKGDAQADQALRSYSATK